jgi:porphobilinogen synthase
MTTNFTSPIRPRRLRKTDVLRRMVRENQLSPDDLIYPLFVRHGDGRTPISSMPGIDQLSVAEAVVEAKKAHELGVPAVVLFGLPAEKDPVGLENFADDGIVQQAIRTIKAELPDLIVITDVCLCEYTDHGHCGLLNAAGDILNDETLNILAKVAISHAKAGADIVAPSGMMDGMVAAIRTGLDTAGYTDLPIMSYAVKYASSFYGPFRDAADGAPKSGDRKSHQMDPANVREALREAAIDIEEGADFLMVKPGLPYLDVIRVVSDTFPELPMVAYNVSGEYAMIKAAAANGWLDERNTVLEALMSFKRAGTDLIITYHALDAARWLQE